MIDGREKMRNKSKINNNPVWMYVSYVIVFIVLMCSVYLRKYLFRPDILRLASKSVESLIFLILSVKNFIKSEKKVYRWMILIAVFLCFFGDVLLGINKLNVINTFVYGLLSFLAGHIFYLISFSRFSKFRIYELFTPVVITGGVYLLSFTDLMNFEGMLKWIMIYSIFVSLLASRCFENLLRNFKDKSIRMYSIGGILFFISDLILMFSMFYKGNFKAGDFLVLSIYYTAMIIITNALGYREKIPQ